MKSSFSLVLLSSFLCAQLYGATLRDASKETNHAVFYYKFQQAVAHNRTEEALEMIKAGGDLSWSPPDTPFSRGNPSPLGIAHLLDNKRVMASLIVHKADIRKRDECGSTFLMRVANPTTKGIALLLLRHGARVSEKNMWGKTALDIARSPYSQLNFFGHPCKILPPDKDLISAFEVAAEKEQRALLDIAEVLEKNTSAPGDCVNIAATIFEYS